MFSAKTAQLANQPHIPAINLSTRALKRLLMSGLLITGFSMAEFVYVLPVTSPTINPYIGYAVTVLTYSVSILLWLRLAFIDPGRLPHVHHSCDAESSTEVVTHAQTGIVFYAGGTIFDTSTCAICGMTLPPETDHCEETNECIVALDHYCPWVGLPIGMRNMLPFVVSLSSLCIHSIWCFFLGVVALVHASTVNDIILGITCLMGSFFGGAFTGGMWGWTLYDVLRDNSPRLYSLCNLQSQTEIRKDDSAHTRNCPKEVIESVHSFVESKMKWLKHPGLRRFVLGSYLPVLYYLSPEQAEYQAWAWTIVLCGTTPL